VTFAENWQTKGADISGPAANQKCSIHHWAEHGIAGRGILLDYRGYAHKKGINYDPYDYYPISWEELYQCGKDQGVDIRPAAQGGDIKIGDMLFIRSGWKEAYDNKSDADRTKAALRHGAGKDGENGQRYAGVSQEQKILDWLHDCYFSSVAGDAPAFEAWPTHEGMKFSLKPVVEAYQLDYHLHEYILALWGMPLGEMLDLEKLAQTCREKNRWFFFFTSAPANCPGKSLNTYVMKRELTIYSWSKFPCQWDGHFLSILRRKSGLLKEHLRLVHFGFNRFHLRIHPNQSFPVHHPTTQPPLHCSCL
jgi:hypothetical protein